jgi:hypothetical protein
MLGRCFLVGPALAAAVTLPAQAPNDTAAFLARLGRDTTAVESFVHLRDRIEGRLVTRAPRTVLRHYVATMGPQHVMTRLEVATLTPGTPEGTPPVQRMVASFARDTAVIEVRRGDSVQTRRVALRGAIPLLAGAWAPAEQLTMHFRSLRRESTEVRVYFVGGTLPVSTVPMRRVARDTVEIGLPTGVVRARIDARGRILGLAGAPGGTQQIVLERLARVDAPALAAEFAARDAQGRGLGPLSPRDTARARVGGANLWVDYSRPSKRSRVIWGGVVPWGEVWRTGANAATQLYTDHDLAMGAVTVPAGTYTLFTIPTPQGVTLIINRQTGQWGTEYHADRDLARLPMRVETLGETVERFTIAVFERPGGGELVLEWDTLRATLSFEVR